MVCPYLDYRDGKSDPTDDADADRDFDTERASARRRGVRPADARGRLHTTDTTSTTRRDCEIFRRGGGRVTYDDYLAGKPVVVTAALTGGVHGKEANPNLPETPAEIGRAAAALVEAGASVVHVHARHRKRRAVVLNRAVPGHRRRHQGADGRRHHPALDGWHRRTRRGTHHPLRTDPPPEMARLDMGPLNRYEHLTSENTRAMVDSLYEEMRSGESNPNSRCSTTATETRCTASSTAATSSNRCTRRSSSDREPSRVRRRRTSGCHRGPARRRAVQHARIRPPPVAVRGNGHPVRRPRARRAGGQRVLSARGTRREQRTTRPAGRPSRRRTRTSGRDAVGQAREIWPVLKVELGTPESIRR